MTRPWRFWYFRPQGFTVYMNILAQTGIQESEWEAATGGAWIPGLALLARNDGLFVFVIPAEVGIQEV